MGIILTIVAFVLVAIVAPFGILYGTIVSLCQKKTSEYFKQIAIALDEFGNVSCSYLFDSILIKKNGYRFGNRKETISSVLGKNFTKGTLTRTGKLISMVLNRIEKDHVQISIDENVRKLNID